MIKKHKVYIVLLFSLIILITAAYKIYNSSRFTLNKTNISSKNQLIKNEKIVLKKGIIPSNMEVIGVKDEKNFYVYSSVNSRSICIFNIETNQMNVFREPIDKNNYIANIKFSSDWIVWIEQKETNESKLQYNWAVYSQNLKSGKINEIEKSGYSIDTNKLPYNFEYGPSNISISKNYLVMKSFDKMNDGNIKSIIKVYNLEDNSKFVADTLEDNKNTFYSDPDISLDNIVWSESSIINNDQMVGNIFLYNIKTKEKKKISNDGRMFKPIINNNIIAATFLEANNKLTKTDIFLYDINKSKWEEAVGEHSNLYKETETLAVDRPIIEDNYMIWWDNQSKNAYIYNIKNKKFCDLSDDGKIKNIVQTRFIGKNIVFWKEWNDNSQKSVHNYAILKSSK